MTLPRSDLTARRDVLTLLRSLRHRALAPLVNVTGRAPAVVSVREVELRFKVDEDCLLPALAAADPALRPAVRAAVEEIALLRSCLAGMQARRSSSAVQRALTSGCVRLLREQWRSVERLAGQGAMVESMDWPALLDACTALLERRGGSAVEDEDRDPVGAAPR